MKEEIWRFWHTYKYWFRVSNYGRVYNGQTRNYVGYLMAGKRYFGVSGKRWSIDKLVYKLFKLDELGTNYVLHLDSNRSNDYEDNLGKVKDGNAARSYYMKDFWKRKRGENHGVSPQKKANGELQGWRSIIWNNGKHETKYFSTHEEARADFIQRWEKLHGEKYLTT